MGFAPTSNRITGAAPFCVEPHRHKQERKDSNPVRLFWRQLALPGAHSCFSVCLAGIEPGTSRVTVSCASLYTTDSVQQPGVRSQGSERQLTPDACPPTPGIVPGGIEPPISSVSGRRLGHSTTGLSVPRPGVEPGTPRSKRGMMSVSPPGHPAEGEGVEPAFPGGKPR